MLIIKVKAPTATVVLIVVVISQQSLTVSSQQSAINIGVRAWGREDCSSLLPPSSVSEIVES